MKILIVDDEPVNVAVLANALKHTYEIRSAASGEEAIRSIKMERPDLILLDIMMPEMDGLQLCKLLRADRVFADLPVIFVTAIDSLEGELEGLELGAVDYITKPVNIRLAKLRIRNQMDLKRQKTLLEEQNELLRQQKIELEDTLARVKRLEGMVAICMTCKKILAEDQSWQRLEQYLCEHTDAVFNHKLCPDCFERQKNLLT